MSALEILKSYLGIDLGDTDRDVELQGYLDRAMDIIEGFMGRPMLEGTYDERGPWERYFITHNWPIRNINEIKLDGEVQADMNLWDIDKSGGVIYAIKNYRRHWVCKYFEINYDGGYEAPYPGWLNEAWALTALGLEGRAGAGSGGGGGEGGSGATGGIKKITVFDIASEEYFEDKSDSTDSGGGSGTSGSPFFLLPKEAVEILSMYRDRQYP